MPDNIWAEISYGGDDFKPPEFVAFRIFLGAQRIISVTLRREIAVELHRRVNRIPEALHEGGLPCEPAYHCHGRVHCSCADCHDSGESPYLPDLNPMRRCTVCNATAEEAPPGLRKDGTGEWLCVSRGDCIDRMWKASDGMVTVDELHHRMHCAACRSSSDIHDSLARWAAKHAAEYMIEHTDDLVHGEPVLSRHVEAAIKARAMKPGMTELLAQREYWIGKDGIRTSLGELTISHAGRILRFLLKRAAKVQGAQAERFYRTLSDADYSDGVADALDLIEAEFELDPEEWMRRQPLYQELTTLLKNAENA
jgi:hypothetical protein